MSISTHVNPFRPYIEQYLAPLQGQIAAWLAASDKTMDDVAWWELTGSRITPELFMYKVRITVIFAGSDVKQEQLFLYRIPLES